LGKKMQKLGPPKVGGAFEKQIHHKTHSYLMTM